MCVPQQMQNLFLNIPTIELINRTTLIIRQTWNYGADEE